MNIAANNSDDFILVKGKRYKFNPSGYDNVQFFISTNLGEDVKPLARIASGGEISRVMLSLKTVLAKTDKLPLLIFDEIDTGVSGHIAQKVGQTLKILAVRHQVIANNSERVKEIAKLMSGENITEASIKGAKELMGLD